MTYQCIFDCDHCFVWGSPTQSGTMTIESITNILHQAKQHGVEWIYFEGGEPFLYYPVLVRGVQLASDLDFNIGIVSNTYWATTQDDAVEWLKPFRGLVQDLSISTDLFHFDEKTSLQSKNALAAAEELGIPIGVISIAQPENSPAKLSDSSQTSKGQIPAVDPGSEDGSDLMYRGRAVEKLVQNAQLFPWDQFDQCPYENFQDPGRVHIDPFGYLHICQGISIGNIFNTALTKICSTYDVVSHPIIAALSEGGPVQLIRHYTLPHNDKYADACHLCYQSRIHLRERFPDCLTPDQMYGNP